MRYKLLQKTSGESCLSLEGALCGDLSEVFGEIVASLSTSVVVIDLKGLSHINSLGVRSWQGFLNVMADSSSVTLTNCPVEFIDYANIIPQILGSCELASLYVPFACASCGKAVELLFSREDAGRSGLVESSRCPSCNGALKAELDLDDYLALVRGA